MSEQTIHRYDFRGQALCGSSNTDDNDAPATHDPRQVTCQECQRRQLPGRCPERQPGDPQDHHFSSTEGSCYYCGISAREVQGEQTSAVDFAAFRWCAVCGTQHHPDNTTCDGLRGGTTDTLAPAAAGDSEPGALIKALQVLVLDPRTRAYLRQHDPRALQQAAKALHDVGERYLVFGDDRTSDLCWYCFAPLVTTFANRQAYCSTCGVVSAPAAAGGGQ